METETGQSNLPNPARQETSQPPLEVNSPASLQAIIHAWSGPLPPPSQLQEYEQSHPGLTERIVVVFEKQFEQRHSLEMRVLDLELEQMHLGFDQRRRGQYLAFFICLAAILGGTYVGGRGQQFVGSIIGGTGLAGLAAAFIYGQAAGAKKNNP